MYSPRRYPIALLLVLVLLTVIAAPVMAYLYSASLAIEETNGTAYSQLPVIFYTNNSWMAANGFMNSTANDTRVETLGGTAYPHMVADNKTLTSLAIPANSQTNLAYTMGGTELDDFYLIFGNGGYFTVSDNASMEPSANWTLDFTDIYLNTATTANLTDKPSDNTTAKPNNLHIATGSGNVTATVSNYVRPLVYTDTSANWTSDANAFDYNIATSASSAGISAGSYTGYFTITIPSQTITSIRYYTSYGGAADIDIDLFYSAAWNNWYEAAISAGSYVELQPSTQTGVTQIRVRMKNNGGAPVTLTLAELQYWSTYSVTQAVTAGEYDVTVQQDNPFLSLGVDVSANITPVSDNLVMNAALWQPDSSSSPFTTIDSNAISATVSGAVWTEGTGYNFNNHYIDFGSSASIAAQVGDLTIEAWIRLDQLGLDQEFVSTRQGKNDVTCPYALYVSSVNKLIMRFGNGAAAYYAIGTTSLTTGVWYHVVGRISGTSIQVFINASQNGSTGTFAAGTRQTGTKLVVGAADTASTRDFYGDIGEVRMYDKALSNAEITQNYNATKLKYGTGSIATYSTLVSVADNSNSWRFLESGAASYTARLAYYTDGVLTADYNPTGIILVTTLPDESGNANNGVITWGANPSGITTTLGSLISAQQPVIGGAGDDVPTDIIEDVNVSDWFVEPDVSGALLTNPIRPLVTILSDTTSLTEQQAWWLLGLVFVLGVTITAMKFVRGHHLITGVTGGAAIGLLVSLTIWPLWTLVFTILAVITGLISERTPSIG